jgi:hypothetical protein
MANEGAAPDISSNVSALAIILEDDQAPVSPCLRNEPSEMGHIHRDVLTVNET